MRRRLIFGALYLLLAVVVGLAVPFGATLSRRLTDELGGRVEREAFAVAAAVEDRLESGDTTGLQPLAEAFARQIGGRVLITNRAGLLLADSLQPVGPVPPSYATRPEIATALASTPSWSVRRSVSLGYDLMVSAVPVRSAAGVLGAVRISYPMSEVRSAIHRAWLFLGLVGGVVLITGLLLAAFLARWVTRPIRAAGAAARVLANGDMDARVPEAGPPEVQELARDLNVMAERLSARVRADREFASNAAHQLRTPLAALRLSLEEARDGPDPRSEVDYALGETDRLSGVVDSLLELAREQERAVEPVDLVDVSRGIAARMDGAGPEIRVTGRGMAMANPHRVGQVIWNLLDNARRFAHTRVRVSVTPGGDDHVVLRVEDDGAGIPEPDRARVFERFYRGVMPRGRGSGLGLAVARELAEADGASIAAGSSDLGGAEFELRYPAASAGVRP